MMALLFRLVLWLVLSGVAVFGGAFLGVGVLWLVKRRRK